LPIGLTNIIAISGGVPSPSDCQVLKSDGTVITWPTGFPSFYTQQVTNLIAMAGTDPSLGLRSNGIVVQWPLESPGTVPGLSNIVAIASDYDYLVLKANGTVAVNPGGPTPPAGLSNVVAIAQGGGHDLALKLDGTVTAWGDNRAGQIIVPQGSPPAGIMALP
jgi:hypothetical protein